MRGRLVSRIAAVFGFLMGAWLLIEDMRPIVFDWHPTTITASLFLMLLSLWVLAGGEISALRERVEQLEAAEQRRSLSDEDGGRDGSV